MDLETQIQTLIQDAPQDGVTPHMVASIAPVLQDYAQQLRHLEYYVVQSLDGNWVVTTLQNATETDLQKVVLYAYPTLKDVTSGPTSIRDPQIMALPVPVLQILFQLQGMDGVDSIVFFEIPGDLTLGAEVHRHELQASIQNRWLQLQSSGEGSPSLIPPDIA